jgi:ATP-dependent DNA ligase
VATLLHRFVARQAARCYSGIGTPEPTSGFVAVGVRRPSPEFVELALATSIEKLPSGTRWFHEIKFDRYRVQVHLRDAAAEVPQQARQ